MEKRLGNTAKAAAAISDKRNIDDEILRNNEHQQRVNIARQTKK